MAGFETVGKLTSPSYGFETDLQDLSPCCQGRWERSPREGRYSAASAARRFRVLSCQATGRGSRRPNRESSFELAEG
jgi:hypothetical protein